MKNSIKYIIILLSFCICSCSTINQSVKVQPISPDIPASASSALYLDGKVIRSDKYTVIEEFKLLKVLKQPISDENMLPIDINNDLKELMIDTNADAVVDLKIQLIKVSPDALDWIALEQTIGAFGATAALFSLIEIITDQGFGSPATVGIIGAGVGLAGIGGSFLHKAFGKIPYEYEVNGKLVRLEG